MKVERKGRIFNLYLVDCPMKYIYSHLLSLSSFFQYNEIKDFAADCINQNSILIISSTQAALDPLLIIEKSICFIYVFIIFTEETVMNEKKFIPYPNIILIKNSNFAKMNDYIGVYLNQQIKTDNTANESMRIFDFIE